MTGMRTPNEVAEMWKRATAEAGQRYMAEPTPARMLEHARDAYARGYMTITDFELTAERAIRAGA